jgi:hypothetical protein
MSYGKAEYNNDGLVKCEICGGYFSRVCNHANKAHNIKAKEYRKMFGFGTQLLISELSRIKSAEKTKNRYEGGQCERFKEKSKSTQFKPGESGRTKVNNNK